MYKSAKWIVAIALLTASAPAWGQNETVLMERIAALETRIAELEGEDSSFMTQQDVQILLDGLRADAATRSNMPPWMENLTFSGDLRLRYQYDCFNDRSNRHNRNRLRYRLRFGIKKTWLDDQLLVVFRLASGTDGYPDRLDNTIDGYSDPTSTNQSFDNAFSEKPLWIDRIYAQYTPNWLEGFTIAGGKMPLRLVHTNMFWDSDVNPEGIWAQYKPTFGPVSPFASVGYWILEESSSAGRDVNLWTFQAGMDWQITEDVEWTSAATYYEYVNFANANVFGRGNHQEANGDYATGFRLINLTNQVKFSILDIPVVTFFDWVYNCGDDDLSSDFDDQNNGINVGVKVGRNRHAGDWSASYRYAYIEANCAPGFWADSDFGYVNRKGHALGVRYNLADFLVFATTLYYTEPIRTGSFNGEPVEDETTTTVQVDLIWNF